MLKIQCGKSGKRKGVLIFPPPTQKSDTKKDELSLGASTSLKEVFQKHASVRKQNISEEKDT